MAMREDEGPEVIPAWGSCRAVNFLLPVTTGHSLCPILAIAGRRCNTEAGADHVGGIFQIGGSRGQRLAIRLDRFLAGFTLIGERQPD